MEKQVFYNLVTRDALVLFGNQAQVLDGPFQSRVDAERAADQLIGMLVDDAEPQPLRHFRASRSA